MTTATYSERAAASNMASQREAMAHEALWHNMQVPQFGRIAEMVWGGQVAVMPDHAVLAMAQAMSKRSKSKVRIGVEIAETPAGQTVYNVGGVLVTVG